MKAKVQGAYQFLTSKGIPFDARDTFKEFQVSERAGYRMIQEGTFARRRHNMHTKLETRGRKSKVTEAQVREVDHILQDEALELEGKSYTWEH